MVLDNDVFIASSSARPPFEVEHHLEFAVGLLGGHEALGVPIVGNDLRGARGNERGVSAARRPRQLIDGVGNGEIAQERPREPRFRVYRSFTRERVAGAEPGEDVGLQISIAAIHDVATRELVACRVMHVDDEIAELRGFGQGNALSELTLERVIRDQKAIGANRIDGSGAWGACGAPIFDALDFKKIRRVGTRIVAKREARKTGENSCHSHEFVHGFPLFMFVPPRRHEAGTQRHLIPRLNMGQAVRVASLAGERVDEGWAKRGKRLAGV